LPRENSILGCVLEKKARPKRGQNEGTGGFTTPKRSLDPLAGTADGALLRLDAGHPDHPAPFIGFFGDELRKVGGRANKHHAIQVGKPSLDLRIGEAGIYFFVQLLDNFDGRIPGRAEAKDGLAS
jgi:hypothetical protein